MLTSRKAFMYILAVVVIASFTLPAIADTSSKDDGPRYERGIRSERDLLDVFAAGLVADAFGYDASEILRQVESEDIPTQDIIPVFYASYLSGRSFQRVVELRADGKDWGPALTKLGISADTLNDMIIPDDISVTNLNDVPDQVFEDLFVCSAVSQVFDLDPDEVFDYYDAGWSSLDVMAAAQVAYRSNHRISSYLQGDAKRVDWYYIAKDEDIDLKQIIKDQGRLFDNITPILSDKPEQGDLETGYAADIAVRNWDVPLSDVQYARYHYLLSPSELLQVFYVSNVQRCGWEWVVKVYTRDSYYRWGPALVVLDVPFRNFSELSIWENGRYDYVTVDPWMLDYALLGYALTYRTSFNIGFYFSTFDPWYSPYYALDYCGAWHRWGIPYSDWHSWHNDHPSRPWWDNPYHSKDYGDFRRSHDWADGRRVSIVVGDRERNRDHARVDRHGVPPTWSNAYNDRGRGKITGDNHPGMSIGSIREGRDYGSFGNDDHAIAGKPRPGGAFSEQGNRHDDGRTGQTISSGRDFGSDNGNSGVTRVTPRDEQGNERVTSPDLGNNQRQAGPQTGNVPTARRGDEYGGSSTTTRERDRQTYIDHSRNNEGSNNRGSNTEGSNNNSGPRVIYRNNENQSYGNPSASNSTTPRVEPAPRENNTRSSTRDYGNSSSTSNNTAPRVQTAPTPRENNTRSNTRDYGNAPSTSQRQISPQRESVPRTQVTAPSSENRERVSPGRSVGSVSGGSRRGH